MCTSDGESVCSGSVFDIQSLIYSSVCSVKGCDEVFNSLTQIQTEYVYSFTRDYLSRQPSQGNVCVCVCACALMCLHKQVLNAVSLIFSGNSCVQSTNSDSDWLLKNFGQFRIIANFTDFINSKRDFNGVSRKMVVCVLLSLTLSVVFADSLLHVKLVVFHAF